MDAFKLRQQVIEDYSEYVRSFVTIRDDRIHSLVEREFSGGHLWPDPLIQLNPAFQPGPPMKDLVKEGLLDKRCLKIFAKKKGDEIGDPFRLHQHQVDAIRAAKAGSNYVLTTGTGSGKSLAYIVPIVDHVLRNKKKGIQAIVVYPMNALANSQLGELEKFLGVEKPPVTFKRYTGQEDEAERKAIKENPPDILLTNYVMLELILTRAEDSSLVEHAKNLQFLVFDELHTYRGRQGSDVSMLIRRVRDATGASKLQHIGTSATLSTEGSWDDQRNEVASVATKIFGAQIEPANVIGETLRRVTPDGEIASKELTAAFSKPPPTKYEAFLRHPLARWIESNIGLDNDAAGRLIRRTPRPLTGPDGAVRALVSLTQLSEKEVDEKLRAFLLAGYTCRDADDQPAFAFRLHQFISKGDAVYASPEAEDKRHITLHAQQYVPDSKRERVLFPLAFCRECGQEYYSVRRAETDTGRTEFRARAPIDRIDDQDGIAGFLYVSATKPWPEPGTQDFFDRVPDPWLGEKKGATIVLKNRTKYIPERLSLLPNGSVGEDGIDAAWIRSPFSFCLQCGVAYSVRSRTDFGRLATLGSEGRSTATTMLSLSAIRRLRQEQSLSPEARKLLNFTDNRQDASLQAGHFNDFVEIGLLRSAILKAVQQAGPDGLRHENMTSSVFSALDLPLDAYADDPSVKYHQREQTDRALREALGYYVYRDLRRGWRVTAPNLEQCGLLDIDYSSLAQFCLDPAEWSDCHPALANAQPAAREHVCRTLLTHLRRELAVRVSYLEPDQQEVLKQMSDQYLCAPWAVPERLERSATAFPCTSRQVKKAPGHFVFVSPRGGLGLLLRKPHAFPDWPHDTQKLKDPDVQEIIENLFERLVVPGILRVSEESTKDHPPGYQLNASALIWREGTGKIAPDPIRVPHAPDGLKPNPFFDRFYREDSKHLRQLEAHEHTAQVSPDERERREEAFRSASLPVMFCSPTMELGVDIAELNVVGMRNVPPTPANYAQRSGRAGRSGQPAFVFTYCSSGSPHDQYFFRHPEAMVSGTVTSPRLDLSNADLVRSHVHAIWMTVSHLELGRSMQEILEIGGDDPSLTLLPEIQKKLDDTRFRDVTFKRSKVALADVIEQVAAVEDSTSDEWLKRVLNQLPDSFDRACDRWRELYRAALEQSKVQSRRARDASLERRDRDRAKRLRAQAEAQINLLLETRENRYSDFYPYRYLASEGFLPGYNFPRLPLSAFLPGRREKGREEEYISRPRFLAINEFGPRGIIYHEGSRYVIYKVILPVDESGGTQGMSLTERNAQCEHCGYLHPLEGDDPPPDLCNRCGKELPLPLENMFRMHNVATKRRDRISSDEEERQRLGYEIRSGVRFALRDGRPSVRTALLKSGDATIATLSYGHAASIWRINVGWRRRQKAEQLGFLLDMDNGIWIRNKEAEVEEGDEDRDAGQRRERVVPFVADTRNCLLLEPTDELDVAEMATLQAALKAAIQAEFQVEDRELAVEALPTPDNRKSILIYEASEGGAGVLRRLVEEEDALKRVIDQALERCHFDPATFEDTEPTVQGRDKCDAACYDCLLSYYNQRDHRHLDRHLLIPILREWRDATLLLPAKEQSRDESLASLSNGDETSPAQRFLEFLEHRSLTLPSGANESVAGADCVPDFVYREKYVAVFIGRPEGWDAIDERLDDAGWTGLVFEDEASWPATIRRYASVFGKLPSQAPPGSNRPAGIALDEFEPAWRDLVTSLTGAGVFVESGEDVTSNGAVVGRAHARLGQDGAVVLVDAEDEAAASALTQQGVQVVAIDPTDPHALALVLEALGNV